VTDRRVGVLFAHCGLDWIRGSERCLLDLVKYLDRGRFHPVVVCNTQSLLRAASDLAVSVLLPSMSEDRGAFLPARRSVDDARRILAEHDISLIHANSFEVVKWFLPAARSAQVPIVAHIHLPSSEDERCYSWLHQVALIAGVSRAAVKGFVDDGLAQRRIRVVYNGVDPTRITHGNASRLRQELGITVNEITLTCIASLIPRKGVDTLLRGFKELTDAMQSRYRLLLVGDGPERGPLQQLTHSLGVNTTVHFLGERHDAGAVLRDATDIAVSLAREEAFPLNILEAAYFGLPVVASNIDPHKEAIVDRVTGLLVQVGDPSAFASALFRLSNDPGLRRAYGAAGRRRVMDDFLVDRYVNSFQAIYESLLARPRRVYGWFGEWNWPAAYNRWFRRLVVSRLKSRARRIYGHRRSGSSSA